MGRRSREAQPCEDRVDVLLTVDSKRKSDCSIPALVVPWPISRRTSSSRGVKEASGLDARVCCRATSVSMISGLTTEPGRHFVERSYQVLKITDRARRHHHR
jgi:hypothetical protein